MLRSGTMGVPATESIPTLLSPERLHETADKPGVARAQKTAPHSGRAWHTPSTSATTLLRKRSPCWGAPLSKRHYPFIFLFYPPKLSNLQNPPMSPFLRIFRWAQELWVSPRCPAGANVSWGVLKGTVLSCGATQHGHQIQCSTLSCVRQQCHLLPGRTETQPPPPAPQRPPHQTGQLTARQVSPPAKISSEALGQPLDQWESRTKQKKNKWAHNTLEQRWFQKSRFSSFLRLPSYSFQQTVLRCWRSKNRDVPTAQKLTGIGLICKRKNALANCRMLLPHVPVKLFYFYVHGRKVWPWQSPSVQTLVNS